MMETERLLIKKTCFDDLRYFAEWETQKNVTDFFSIDVGKTYEDVVRESILWESDLSTLQFTIFLKEENNPIGRIYISGIKPNLCSLDITRIYIGDERYRGNGFGEEAMKEILKYCFVQLNAERVTLDHVEGNEVAASLYLKLGFQYEGIARNACKRDGKHYDLHYMSMLRPEYFA